jgi:hypothetical protein
MVVNNVEEFANSIGIDIKRFNELSELVSVVMKHHDGAEYGQIMQACLFGRDPIEDMFIGMLLGRAMQESICCECQEEDAEVPVVLMVVRTDKPIKT